VRKKISTTSEKKDRKRSLLAWIFFLPILLSLIGLFFVFEASSVRAFTENGDSFHYLKLQSIWIVISVVVMLFVSSFDYHKLYYVSFPAMMGTIFLLLLVLFPGVGHRAGGAQRWIDLGVINFQPTEFAKLATILYLASWFIHRERQRFFSFLFLLSFLMVLILAQPDMGTAIIIFLLSITIYFIAGFELHFLGLLLPFSIAAGWILVKISPYRFKRLSAFFDPTLDPLGITYHINQILISLSNGGLFGQGFGASRQKYLFLPEAHTDSIFAIIGEEAGFVGSVFLIGSLIILIYLLYRITTTAPDRFGRLLGGGIFAFFSLQILVNLGAMVKLIPLTGVPLPFFSYGGSNLLTSFILLGIMVNIARQSRLR